jgi:hypothetical protein
VKMSLSLYFAGFAFAQLYLRADLGRRRPQAGHARFLAIYTVGSAARAVRPTIETLIAARLLQGIGAAVGVAMSRAIVRDLFTHEQSARIMNLIGIILAVGPGASRRRSAASPWKLRLARDLPAHGRHRRRTDGRPRIFAWSRRSCATFPASVRARWRQILRPCCFHAGFRAVQRLTNAGATPGALCAGDGAALHPDGTASG